MKTLLLIHPPFCTPASPPYSLSHIYAALKESCKEHKVKALDLNLELNRISQSGFSKYSKKFLESYELEEYESKAKTFIEKMKQDCAESNKNVIKGSKPLLFNEMLETVMKHKPDIAAFSLVYSSQTLYAYTLISELKKLGVQTIVGGPATSSVLAKTADKFFPNHEKLSQFLNQKNRTSEKHYIPDFKIWSEKEYFTPEIVVPVKTSTTCYYKRCAYCTHYSNEPYQEYPLEKIYETVKEIPKGRAVFIVDDMISKNRLLDIASIFKKRNLTWVCQLRPTKEYDKNTLKHLSESGLKMIIWGVESGSNRILKLINKRTNIKDIKQVLSDSQNAGIKNVCYALFGFPTETKEEFLKTLRFLKDNSQNIDLISTSVFGLQKNTPVYNNPKKYGIKNVTLHERHFLDERVEYEPETGISKAQAKKLRYRYKHIPEAINKYPKSMNFFREHMLCLIKKENHNL